MTKKDQSIIEIIIETIIEVFLGIGDNKKKRGRKR